MRRFLAAAAIFAGPLAGSLPAAAAPPGPEADPESGEARPAPAGKHCLDEARVKIAVDQTLGGSLNPSGVEQELALRLCAPLIRAPGVLFDLTSVEVGLLNILSPTYVHQGVFAAVTPLSPLVLRAELTGVYVWTLPLNGAGYFRYPGYDADARDELKTEDLAEQAAGYNLGLSATLRARIGPDRGAGLIVLDSFLAEHWSLGDGPYYANLRRDVLMAASDWVLKNTGVVLGDIPLSADVTLRAGAVNATTVVPASRLTTNALTGMVALPIRRLSHLLWELQPFVLAGAYTHHASAGGLRTGEATLLAGASATYDIATLGP